MEETHSFLGECASFSLIDAGSLLQPAKIYKIKICIKCKWDCVQDEEHVLLDCPGADLANLCGKHRQPFRSPRLLGGPPSSSSRLRDFTSQADTKGLALYVHECLECCA